MLEWGRKVLASQPFSVLLGAELVAFSPGIAELKVPIRPGLKQQNGFVHGGAISYAADNALTYAGGSALGRGVVTSEFKINYVRPALGEFLRPRHGRHAGKSQAVCRRDVFVSSQGARPCARSRRHDYAARAGGRGKLLIEAVPALRA